MPERLFDLLGPAKGWGGKTIGKSLLRPLVSESAKAEIHRLKEEISAKEPSRQVLIDKLNTTTPVVKSRQSQGISVEKLIISSEPQLDSSRQSGPIVPPQESQDETLNDVSLSVTEDNTTTSDLSKYLDGKMSSTGSQPVDTCRSDSTVKGTETQLTVNNGNQNEPEMDNSLVCHSPVITDRTTKAIQRRLTSDSTQTDENSLQLNGRSIADLTAELKHLEDSRPTLEVYHRLQWTALTNRQKLEKDNLEEQIRLVRLALDQLSTHSSADTTTGHTEDGETTPTVDNSQTENFFGHFLRPAAATAADHSQIKSSTPNKTVPTLSGDVCTTPVRKCLENLMTPVKVATPKRISLSPAKVAHSVELLSRRLPALIRGYLVRRLMRTEKIVELTDTIKEALHQMDDLSKQFRATTQPIDQLDRSLYNQLKAQVTAAKRELKAIMFEVPIQHRMALLDRQRVIDRSHLNQRKEAVGRRLSSATRKSLERKQRQTSLCREFEQKPVSQAKKRPRSSVCEMKRPATAQHTIRPSPRRLGSAISRHSLPTYSPRKYPLKRSAVAQAMKQNRPAPLRIIGLTRPITNQQQSVQSNSTGTNGNQLHSVESCNPQSNLNFPSCKPELNRKPWK